MDFFPPNLYSGQTLPKFEDAGRDGFCPQQDSAPSPLAIERPLRPVAAWLTLPARCPPPAAVPGRSCPTSRSWSLTSPFPSVCGKVLSPPTSSRRANSQARKPPRTTFPAHSPTFSVSHPAWLSNQPRYSIPYRHPSPDRPPPTKRSLVHRVEGPTSASARVRQASLGSALVRGDLEVMVARGCARLVVSR